MLQERHHAGIFSDSLASWVLSTCSQQVNNTSFNISTATSKFSSTTKSTATMTTAYDFQDIAPPLVLFREEGTTHEDIECGFSAHFSSAISLSSSSSSDGESHMSSGWPQSTGESSYWTCLDPLGSSSTSKTTRPPKIIDISNPTKHQEPTSVPYAQLCFDPINKTLVTLMEIDLPTSSSPGSSGYNHRDHNEGEGGKGKDKKNKKKQLNKKRIYLDQYYPSNETSLLPKVVIGSEEKVVNIADDYFIHPKLMPSPSSGSGCSSSTATDSTLSSRWGSSEHDNTTTQLAGSSSVPIVLSSTEVWLEETELDLYLLHECCHHHYDHDDPYWRYSSSEEEKAGSSCTDSLRKLIHAYRARIVSTTKNVVTNRDANNNAYWEAAQKQPFLGIGYNVLDHNNDNDN